MGIARELLAKVHEAYAADRRDLSVAELVSLSASWGFVPVKAGRSRAWRVERVEGAPQITGWPFLMRVELFRFFVARRPQSMELDDYLFQSALWDRRVRSAVNAIRNSGERWERITVTPVDGDKFVVNPPGPVKALEGMPRFSSEAFAIEVASKCLAAAGGGRLIVQGPKGRITKNLKVDPAV